MGLPPEVIGVDAGVSEEGDTIVAISTAAGSGAIGIVRMSGPEAIAIAAGTFKTHAGDDIRSAQTFSLTYGHVVGPDSGQIVDEVLVGVMRAPRSYTREDVVEIHCHGGVLAVRGVLQVLVGLGARIAEPGEFTRRAFMNGRIDLAQAESVAAVVAARSRGALRASLQQLGGGLSRRLSLLRGDLVTILAGIEACVDFSDEDVDEVDWGSTMEALERVRGRLRELCATALLGSALEHGVKVAIVGKPNAGKSSLLNALALRERAIVSDVPGTTRDTVEEQLEIAGVLIRLVDTAGLRSNGEGVERMGIERSLQALQACDLVLAVIDLADTDRDGGAELTELAGGRPCVLVGNKADLVGAGSRAFEEMSAAAGGAPGGSGSWLECADSEKVWAREVSALTGDGIEDLRELIGAIVTGGAVELDEPILVSERQRDLVAEATMCVERALAAAGEGVGEELVADDVRAAAEAIGRITGEDLSADLLDEIFGRFCLGK